MKIRSLIWLFGMSILLLTSQCKKKSSNPSLSPKGVWSITNVSFEIGGALPNSLSGLVGGTANFTDKDYELKDNGGNVVESGTYVYTASSNSLQMSPSAVSVFPNQSNPYVLSSLLTSNSLELKLNIAAASKPQFNLILLLNK
ncbi:hypothetical protein AD998_08590 [bacterium 336/3]|nr:hypothetical protein AD998_08590 [bacterium 336/3]